MYLYRSYGLLDEIALLPLVYALIPFEMFRLKFPHRGALFGLRNNCLAQFAQTKHAC